MRDRKSKVFSLRISPNEYEQLREACATRGLRSIGELARTAMHHLLYDGSDPTPTALAITELRDRIAQLSREIEGLAQRLTRDGTD